MGTFVDNSRSPQPVGAASSFRRLPVDAGRVVRCPHLRLESKPFSVATLSRITQKCAFPNVSEERLLGLLGNRKPARVGRGDRLPPDIHPVRLRARWTGAGDQDGGLRIKTPWNPPTSPSRSWCPGSPMDKPHHHPLNRELAAINLKESRMSLK